MLRKHVAWALGLMILAVPLAAQSGPNVYVVDFTTRDLKKNAQTAKFTHDFEQALVQSSCYQVLESDVSRLLTELDREQAIADISQLSSTALKNLKAKQASMVIFGEVFDDVDSGQVSVIVTFQKFDRTKALIKSTLIPRGKSNDAESRQAAMNGLAGDLCRRTATINRKTSNDFIFELEECRKQERTVTCDLLVTNNGEDRRLFVGGHASQYANPSTRNSRMYDDFSDETLTSRIVLARRESDRYGVTNSLISGRPAKLELYFDGVSSKATMITRLDVECWEGERQVKFPVQFRNIPLK